MKIRMFVSILPLCLVVMIIAGSFATGQDEYVVKEAEELFGTWINTDYDEVTKYSKIVIKPDGKSEYYNASTYKDFDKGEFVITNKWLDSMGNIWYTMIEEIPRYMIHLYSLCEVSNSGKTLQYIFNNRDYPTEMDPEDTRYSIYYRQE